MSKNILLLVLFSFFLVACDDCVFTSRNTTVVKVRFYSKTRNPTQPVRIYFDSLITTANFLLLKDSTREATVSFPLHPYENVSKFYIIRTIREGNQLRKVRDSIAFSYQRNFSAVSPRCGYDQRIDNLELLRFGADSIEIFKPALEVGDTVNVRIFL
jgi:hypothetical protein